MFIAKQTVNPTERERKRKHIMLVHSVFGVSVPTGLTFPIVIVIVLVGILLALTKNRGSAR